MASAEKAKRIAQWIIAAFLVIGALVYFPSITSVIFVIAAVAAAPIPKLRALLASVGVRGWKLGLIAALLFVGGCVLAPVSESTAPPTSSQRETCPAAQ